MSKRFVEMPYLKLFSANRPQSIKIQKNNNMRIAFTLLTTLVLAFGQSNAYAQAKFELEDYAKFVGMSDPQISPDGKSVVIVVTRPDYANNRYNSELVLVDIASGKKSILTHERISVSSPRWSPNGEHLCFISKVGPAKDALKQIFMLSMKGGEAKQITKAPMGVQHFSWSPNSTDIAYATLNEPKNKTEIENGFTAFEITNNDMFVEGQPQPAHIWIVNTNNSENKRMTDGDWSLPKVIPPGESSSPFSWSPDGKSILFVKAASAYSGVGFQRTIQLLNAADGTYKPLTTRTKPNQSESC